MHTKYIRTSDGTIIVFPATMKHSKFSHFDPVSAGFISFGLNENRNPSCTCWGESESLKLKSDPDDTRKAQFQIVNGFKHID